MLPLEWLFPYVTPSASPSHHCGACASIMAWRLCETWAIVVHRFPMMVSRRRHCAGAMG